MRPIQQAVILLGGPSKAGRALGVSHEAVRRWINDVNRVTAERAVAVEVATGGQVTREQLRPDLFAPAAHSDAPPPSADTLSSLRSTDPDRRASEVDRRLAASDRRDSDLPEAA